MAETVIYAPSKTQLPIVYIDKEEVRQWIEQGKQDFLIIDLRRTDFVGGNIKGALNVPAQGIYGQVSTIYKLLEKAGISKVVFHCNSSGGRACRAWGWFEDLAEEKNNTVVPLVLKGGIQEWAKGGEAFTDLLDGYDASVFSK